MRRLSIEVTPEQHQRLKALAALSDKSIKDYVLDRVLPSTQMKGGVSDEDALSELEAFLQPRIAAAERGELGSKSVEEIFNEVIQKH